MYTHSHSPTVRTLANLIFRQLTCPALSVLIAATVSASGSSAGTKSGFVDVLDKPARISPLAASSPLFAVSSAGRGNAVAVGPRGHILRSTDQGSSWIQRPVPLSSDLVAVHFADAQRGWAVGHDAVVLATQDGGESWQRLLDGRSLPAMLLSHYEARLAAGETGLDPVVEDVRRMKDDGPTRPLLSVYFRNAQDGWAMGQFNLLLRTTDGGRSWQPWMDRTENPDALSLHAMADVGGALYIVGEAGLVLRLDAAGGIFRRVTTPFSGSWFGLTGNPRCIIAFGLQGTAARSCDGGTHWSRIETGTRTAINGGLVTGDGRLMLLAQQGRILVGDPVQGAVTPLPQVAGLRGTYGVLEIDPGWIVVVGEQGVTRLALPAPPAKP